MEDMGSGDSIWVLHSMYWAGSVTGVMVFEAEISEPIMFWNQSLGEIKVAAYTTVPLVYFGLCSTVYNAHYRWQHKI